MPFSYHPPFPSPPQNTRDSLLLHTTFAAHAHTPPLLALPVCSNIAFKVRFAVDEESRDVKATYLDTEDRPVVVIIRHNLVDEHGQDFEVWA